MWIIWSDVAPLLLYVALFFHHATRTHSAHRTHTDHDALGFLRTCEAGVFIGCIVCRLASSFYHVFNCANQWTIKQLVQLDYAGISCMTLPVPFFYLAHQLSGPLPPHALSPLHDPYFTAYFGALFGMQALCLIMFACSLAWGESPLRSALREPCLCVLAALGNLPLLQLALNPHAEVAMRAHATGSLFALLVGYAVFFKGHLPERLLPLGASDGRWFNSHVLWHGAMAAAQLALLSAVMLCDADVYHTGALMRAALAV